jgi:hypothetical protein
MLKKNYYIFRLENIFDFSHSRFNIISAKSDKNGIKSKTNLEQWYPRELNFF